MRAGHRGGRGEPVVSRWPAPVMPLTSADRARKPSYPGHRAALGEPAKIAGGRYERQPHVSVSP
jgi:hypothetical protein